MLVNIGLLGPVINLSPRAPDYIILLNMLPTNSFIPTQIAADTGAVTVKISNTEAYD